MTSQLISLMLIFPTSIICLILFQLLNDCIVDIIDRCIPSCNLKFRSKDTAWLSDKCRESFFRYARGIIFGIETVLI